MHVELEKLLRSHRTIVMLGAGGVGKTTTSIALAINAAQLGRKTAVLSIDPAKRLADALGIPLGRKLNKVDLDDRDIPGSLHACMIDQKSVFDLMVQKYSPHPKIEKKILNHRLYQSLTKYLGGAIEFMALAQLQELVESDEFDLIILDTPPAQHALDFLAKPNILADFFNSSITKVMLKPFVLASKLGLGRVMSFGEKMMGGLAKVAGVKSLEMLAEFMLLMQEVLAGFNRAGEQIVETLKDERSTFLLVNAPRQDAVNLSLQIQEEVAAMGYRVKGTIWNRDVSALMTQEDLIAFKKNVEDFDASEDLRVLMDSVSNQLILLKSFQEQLSKVAEGGAAEDSPFVVRIPEMVEDIHSVEGMKIFADALKN